MSCYKPLMAGLGKAPDGHSFIRFGYHSDLDQIWIPCGRCIGCRLDYSRAWADRVTLEMMDHDPESCWFVTLTYDDDHLPRGSLGLPTLVTKHTQDFLKRLRFAQAGSFAAGLRFFLSGEYGEKTARPHYHAIFMGLYVPDVRPYGRNGQGDVLWRSDWLDRLWSHGMSVLGRASWHTAAYVARYATKALKGKAKEFYEDAGIVPEFARMSRRPGLGVRYFEQNWQRVYDLDKIYLSDGQTARPPRVFDERLKGLDVDLLERVKAQRAARARLDNPRPTDFDEIQYFEIAENAKKSAVLGLKRFL